jgi:hypothetical protein
MMAATATSSQTRASLTWGYRRDTAVQKVELRQCERCVGAGVWIAFVKGRRKLNQRPERDIVRLAYVRV